MPGNGSSAVAEAGDRTPYFFIPADASTGRADLIRFLEFQRSTGKDLEFLPGTEFLVTKIWE